MYQDYFNYLSPFLVLLGGSLIVFGFLFIGLYIFFLFSKWKVYQKAGKFGWEAVIPFYNTWVLVEITGLKWWFFFIACATSLASILSLGLLIPFGGLISLVGLFCCHYNLAKKFNKEPIGYAIGLTILPIIFYPILAFSQNNTYNPDVEVSPYGPVSEAQVNEFQNNRSNNNVNSKTTKTNNKTNFCKNCGQKIGKDKFCSSCGTEIK